MFDINTLVLPHILTLKPYSSARDEYAGDTGIFLDANENAYGTPGVATPGVVASVAFHRYPDPHQQQLKQRIAEIKQMAPDHIFLGNGSDEAIDLLIRAFCAPHTDNIITLPPTYGMYEVAASINQVGVHTATLMQDFQIAEDQLMQAVDAQSKLVFFCSPNNPTGNILSRDTILRFARQFSGLVVVDEAYIDFAGVPSLLEVLSDVPNLVVLQTFSKAWGMAALRLGMAFASPPVIQILNKIKPPYNVNALTQQKAMEVLAHPNQKEKIVQEIIAQREKLAEALSELPLVEKVYPSDANFLLVRVRDAYQVFNTLIREKVIVRDRSSVLLCEGCLRITVGTPEENQTLLEKLKAFQGAFSA